MAVADLPHLHWVAGTRHRGAARADPPPPRQPRPGRHRVTTTHPPVYHPVVGVHCGDDAGGSRLCLPLADLIARIDTATAQLATDLRLPDLDGQPMSLPLH